MNSPVHEVKDTAGVSGGDRVGGAAALLIVVACIGFSHYVGYRQFGGYDLSPVIDLLYRLHAGEQPGRDFINTLPLSFVAYLYLCQKLFGVSWSTLIVGGSLIFAAASAAIYCLGAPFMNRRLRIAAVLVLAVPTLVTNHVWHSSFSAYVAIIFVLCLLSLLTGARQLPRWLYWTGLGVLAGVTFYAKQNVGLPLTALLLAYCCFRAWRLGDRTAALAAGVMIASTAAATLLFMLVLGVDLQSIVYTFRATSGRALPTMEQLEAVFLPPGAVIVHLVVIYAIWVVARTPGVLRRRDPSMIVFPMLRGRRLARLPDGLGYQV